MIAESQFVVPMAVKRCDDTVLVLTVSVAACLLRRALAVVVLPSGFRLSFNVIAHGMAATFAVIVHAGRPGLPLLRTACGDSAAFTIVVRARLSGYPLPSIAGGVGNADAVAAGGRGGGLPFCFAALLRVLARAVVVRARGLCFKLSGGTYRVVLASTIRR